MKIERIHIAGDYNTVAIVLPEIGTLDLKSPLSKKALTMIEEIVKADLQNNQHTNKYLPTGVTAIKGEEK